MVKAFCKQVAERNHDVQLTDFVESEFLAEQVKYNFGVYKICFYRCVPKQQQK